MLYLTADTTSGGLSVEDHIYLIVEQTLGVQAAGNPMGGKRLRLGRDLAQADWPRVYDVIVRLHREYQRAHVGDEYCSNVNALLAAHGIAWDLSGNGQLHRVIPIAAQRRIVEGLEALAAAGFESALELYDSACAAFDARPRRDRDACANMFDSMEAIAKIKLGLPNATFGDCLAEARRWRTFSAEILSILDKLNNLRNKHFGHGMTTPFVLTAGEVDSSYLSCVGGVILFARI